MGALLKSEILVSVEDYLSGELLSEIRHEYVGGEVYAMAGANNTHNILSGNIFAALHAHLEGTPCVPYVSGMKVKVKAANEEIFYYPDVMVACDPFDNAKLWREKPVVIVEVSSPETARIDAREKNWAYQTIPSLEVYIMISQSACEVTVFRRANGWKPEIVRDPGGTLVVEPLKFTLPLARLFARTGLVG
jgi:Uma2 family endonuclease